MMKTLTTLVALVSTTLTASLCEAADPKLIRGLMVRQTGSSSTGGFATRSATCATGQVDCGGGIAQEICCPSGTFCFNNSDGVCCPTSDTDCTDKTFAAPTCADPSWFLCTDYQPNIPGFVANDPGYWCCPTGTQCLVTENAGFVCKAAAESGDVAGSTVVSGQAPTQASTATTAPTLAASAGTSGKASATGGGTGASVTSAPSGTKAQTTQGQSTVQGSNPGVTSQPAKSGAIKMISSLAGLLVAQAAFGLGVAYLM